MDFHWPEHRLVVEIDGPGHGRDPTRSDDQARDGLLRARRVDRPAVHARRGLRAASRVRDSTLRASRSSSDGPQTARDRRAAGRDGGGARSGLKRRSRRRRRHASPRPPGPRRRGRRRSRAAARRRGSCGGNPKRSGRRPPGGCATRSGSPRTASTPHLGPRPQAQPEPLDAPQRHRSAREDAPGRAGIQGTASDRRPQPPARWRFRETLRADRPRLASERPRRRLFARGPKAPRGQEHRPSGPNQGPGPRRPLRQGGAKTIFVGAGLRLRGPAGVVQPWPNHDDHLPLG